MNTIYRIVWSATARIWVAVAESAKARGKGCGRSSLRRATVILAAAGSLAAIGQAQAAPMRNEIPFGYEGVAVTARAQTATTSKASAIAGDEGCQCTGGLPESMGAAAPGVDPASRIGARPGGDNDAAMPADEAESRAMTETPPLWILAGRE